MDCPPTNAQSIEDVEKLFESADDDLAVDECFEHMALLARHWREASRQRDRLLAAATKWSST